MRPPDNEERRPHEGTGAQEIGLAAKTQSSALGISVPREAICPMSCGAPHCPWNCPFELNAEAFPDDTTVHADDLAARDAIMAVFPGTEVVRPHIGGAS